MSTYKKNIIVVIVINVHFQCNPNLLVYTIITIYTNFQLCNKYSFYILIKILNSLEFKVNALKLINVNKVNIMLCMLNFSSMI